MKIAMRVIGILLIIAGIFASGKPLADIKTGAPMGIIIPFAIVIILGIVLLVLSRKKPSA